MSVFANWLAEGSNQPNGTGIKARFARWLGRRLALRHRLVTLGPDTSISPAAWICPRRGRIAVGARGLISAGAMIQGNVRIGDDCSVQNYAVLVGYGDADAEDAAGRIVIGDGVRIAAHTMMIAANHVFDDPDQPIRLQGMAPAGIVVEDDVWIGGRVTVTAGVRIGRGSVVGAGAVVTKDIPPMSVAVGVPARVVKRRN